MSQFHVAVIRSTYKCSGYSKEDSYHSLFFLYCDSFSCRRRQKTLGCRASKGDPALQVRIVAREKDEINTRLREAIVIKRLRPELNTRSESDLVDFVFWLLTFLTFDFFFFHFVLLFIPSAPSPLPRADDRACVTSSWRQRLSDPHRQRLKNYCEAVCHLHLMRLAIRRKLVSMQYRRTLIHSRRFFCDSFTTNICECYTDVLYTLRKWRVTSNFPWVKSKRIEEDSHIRSETFQIFFLYGTYA